MKIYQKKPFAVMMVLILAMSVITACSSTKKNEDQPLQSGTGEYGFYSAPFSNGKYETPVTITVGRIWGTDIPFKEGESIENNIHIQWAKDTLGIDLKYTLTSPSADVLGTRLRLALSANEELPDIISYRGDTALLHELIDSGRFIAVDEYFGNLASDTWKSVMNIDPTVWYPYEREGVRYALPLMDYARNNDPVMWIREDWLQKLNLKAPETIDELEAVMDAFLNRDPDGDNMKNTIPLTVGFKTALNTYMSESSWIFGAFGAMPNQWNELSDGTLGYGTVQPEMKAGLARMSDWMKKGYISQEAALSDEVKATESFTAGKAGIIVGPYWMHWWPLVDVKKNVPTAEYKAYKLPVGPDGTAGRHGSQIHNGVVLINKNAKHPDAFFVYQSYLFDHYANPQKGSEFEYGLAEGYDWKMKDGKPTNADTDFPEGTIPVFKYTITYDGARIPSLLMDTFVKLNSGQSPSTPYEESMSRGEVPETINAAAIVMEQADITKPQMFTGKPTATMQTKWDFLAKMEQETINKIIYGEQPLDSFDEFVAKWKESGGDAITKEVNDWYQSVKK